MSSTPTPLQKAARSGDATLLSIVLDSSSLAAIDVADENGRSPLLIASSLGHLDVVKALVAAGANLDAEDLNGQTAQSLATASEFRDVAEFLASSAAKQAALWQTITGAPTSSNTNSSFDNKQGVDVMAMLLKEAGLPAGPKESPF